MYINKEKFSVGYFSSGEMKLLRNDLDEKIVNGRVEVLYNGGITLFNLYLILDYYKQSEVLVDLTLAYLPHQRMDRENINLANSIVNVASMFNSLNLNSLTICEPHTEISSFNSAKEFRYIEHLKDSVFSEINYNQKTDAVVLTDKGGYDRYKNTFADAVYFNKMRDKVTGLIIKHEFVGNLKNKKRAIIVDDIVSTGDTIVNVIEHLTNLGVKEIFVFAGHFEKNKYNKRLFEFDNLKFVFSTNSLTKVQNKKLKLFKVNEILYK